MTYIKPNLLDKEKVVYSSGKHWIVFFPLVIWLSLAFFLYTLHLPPMFLILPLGLAGWSFLSASIEFFFSEYIITNQRVIMKEGLFWRSSIETVLDSVAKSEVTQSILGRLLGYGQLLVFGFGGANRFISMHQPTEFQRQLSAQLEKH